jgi:glyoxylase-like metal-dependent hydrolase (beta-lactamase superfamily II)
MSLSTFLARLSRFAATAVATALVTQAGFAQAAEVGSDRAQAPGYYRQVVGEAVVTAVYDGYIDLDANHLAGLDKDQVQALIAREFQGRSGLVQTAVNAFIVETADRLILIDSGSSDCFGPTMGAMVSNIRAAGYDPAAFDTVLLTHMHPDHACGVATVSGEAAFPKATVWADADDAAFWLDPATADRLPADQKIFVEMAQKAIAPYADAGRFRTFQDGEALAPGLTSYATPGHTPGHTSYLLRSGDDELLFWGDIVHFHAVQLRHPEVTIEVDVDGPAAIATRRRVLADVADHKWWIATAHLPFPGIGHIRREQEGYAYVPAAYAPLPSR